MSKTLGMILDRCAAVLGDDSAEMRSYLTETVNDVLYELWDEHDWTFKHKKSQFTTVSGTEEYDLTTVAPDLRSAQDIEMVYDFTNGQKLERVETRDNRLNYPKEDSVGQPWAYSAWDNKVIQLLDNPDGAYVLKFLYLANPTLPTTEADDLETVCGVPVYLHSVVEKLTLLSAMNYYDDSRYSGLYNVVYGQPGGRMGLLPKAINADMRYLENPARIKFWEEDKMSTGFSNYNDYLKTIF